MMETDGGRDGEMKLIQQGTGNHVSTVEPLQGTYGCQPNNSGLLYA